VQTIYFPSVLLIAIVGEKTLDPEGEKKTVQGNASAATNIFSGYE
jgi:hypothetical protein